MNEEVQPKNKKIKYISIVALLFFILSLASLFLNITIGGCQYSDLSFNFEEVIPADKVVKSDGCSSIEIDGVSGLMMSGDYDLEVSGSIDGELFRPLTPLSKTEFTLKIPESGEDQVIIKGSSRYNIIGLVSSAFYYFLLIFLILFIIAKIYKNKELKSNKNINNI